MKKENISHCGKNKISNIFCLVRPTQWIKNVMVFLPVIFSGRYLDIECWKLTLIAAICFCLISSSIYCINDIKDRNIDRLDPEKCLRPVASGSVTVKEASMTGVLLAIISILVSLAYLPADCSMILVIYLVLNILYSFWLKNVMLVDVCVISLGFVLRVVMGGVATSIWISPWIVIMVFLLALFLALSKRRHEVAMVMHSEKKAGRKSVAGYTLPFLNSAMSMLGAVLVMGYIMYTVQPKYGKVPESEYLYITSLPVLLGILRYLQLTIVENRTGDPTRLAYSDIVLLTTVSVWIISFIIIVNL